MPKTRRVRRSVVVGENLLRCMDPKVRESFGSAGLLASEAIDKKLTRDEKQEHNVILSWCHLYGVRAIHASMAKRSMLPVGWPDFTFVFGPHVLYDEIKVHGRKLSEDQKKVIAELEFQGAIVLRSASAGESIASVRSWLLNLGWQKPTT